VFDSSWHTGGPWKMLCNQRAAPDRGAYAATLAGNGPLEDVSQSARTSLPQ
jgi:hypothetical protein